MCIQKWIHVQYIYADITVLRTNKFRGLFKFTIRKIYFLQRIISAQMDHNNKQQQQQQRHAKSMNRDNKSIPEANVINSYVS